MLEPLYLETTEDKPSIVLDSEKGIFEFKGKSLPDDPNTFFAPIKDWINEYIKNPNDNTEVNCRLDYLNTSSFRVFIELFTLFGKLDESGKKVMINWIVEDGDMLLEDKGSDMQMIIKSPFKIIKISPNN